MKLRSTFLLALVAVAALSGCMDKSPPDAPQYTGDLRDKFAGAIRDGDVAAVSDMLSSQPLLLNAAIPTANNKTPLHIAAGAGNASMITLLLEQGADPYFQDDEGQFPQDVAIALGASQEVVDLLQHP